MSRTLCALPYHSCACDLLVGACSESLSVRRAADELCALVLATSVHALTHDCAPILADGTMDQACSRKERRYPRQNRSGCGLSTPLF